MRSGKRSEAALLGVSLALFGATALPQELPIYGGDPGGMRYSALREINRGNVQRFRPVWIFHTGDVSDGSRWAARSTFEATPLVVHGVMYVSTPFARVFVLNPETGEELWSFDPRIDRVEMSNSGVTYLSNGGKHRLFLGTVDGRLSSIVAES